ncbi:DUF2306 domain-containing protein [Spirosoma pollinicola]|uniref:DUF2306 domain-containing protein n=1 Tax=Spirosoma pollinicola TaxID=2057025 RepID=A0A2K8YZS4_9BACT|nr:DUF2306 domain-containing protein [Spirosoma pollinicola]AUD03137.1 DUF2306 domain-containing protein [Spirosoma pollinicola]
MKTIIISLLIIHIATGCTALLAGLIPMFSRKGSRLHNRAGLIYVYCMIVVAVSALLLCVLQPLKMMRIFLTGIAIFSFYLSMTGWRATKQKKSGPAQADRILTYITLAVSVLMVGFGIYLMALNGTSFFPIVFSFFGVLTFIFARKDFQLINHPVEKMHWFFQHFTRMGGSYIATFTAALVTNIGRIVPTNAPDWIATAGWIAPSIIGGMIIGRTVRYYKQKFDKPEKSALV